jgi:hypothetical protein
MNSRRSGGAIAVAAAALALGGHAGANAPKAMTCTIAAPDTNTTVEVRIANADDFCELLAQGLGSDVFHRPTIVTTGSLWHYAGATVSCRLAYRRSPSRIVVSNSPWACRWFLQTGTGWRRLADTR